MASRSPKPGSISLFSPTSSAPSSARPSFDASSSAPQSPASSIAARSSKPRPNRSALRQFYGLGSSGSDAGSVSEEVVPELDRDDLDAEAYVARLCERLGVRELLHTENELLSEIRGLDGERKALVYDNYSKLIAATETIRRMRASMEPLAPTTSTLEPAIAHIAEVSGRLVGGSSVGDAGKEKGKKGKVEEEGEGGKEEGEEEEEEEVDEEKLRKQKEAVRWALQAPEQITKLLASERKEDAQRVWERLQQCCAQWEGVSGTKELLERGTKAWQGTEGGAAKEGAEEAEEKEAVGKVTEKGEKAEIKEGEGEKAKG